MKLAIMGFGTIGSGVAAIVEQNGDCATIGISETAKDSIALMQENPLVIEIDSESRKMKIVDVVGSAKKEPVPSSK